MIINNTNREDMRFFISQISEDGMRAMVYELYRNTTACISEYDVSDGKRIATYYPPHDAGKSGYLGFAYCSLRRGSYIYYAPRWHVQKTSFYEYDIYQNKYKEYFLEDQTDKLLDASKNKKGVNWWNTMQVIESPRFSNIIAHKDFLYLTPSSYPGIIGVDLKRGITETFGECSELAKRLLLKREVMKSYPFGVSEKIGEVIYIACRLNDALITFNCETKVTDYIELGDGIGGNHHILRMQDSLLLFSNEKPVVREYDVIKHSIVRTWNFTDEVDTISGWTCVTGDGRIAYALYGDGNKNIIFRVHPDSGNAGKYHGFDELIENRFISSLAMMGNRLYAICGGYLFVNEEGKEGCTVINLDHGNSIVRELHKSYVSCFEGTFKDVITELNEVKLEDYLLYVMRG